MTASLIGIVGATGAVGGAALSILVSEGRSVRAGYHSNAKRSDAASGCQWRHVDADDADSLARFCDGCGIVLNAAGPSCRIGDRVARAAILAGADYVDAFGGGALLRTLSASALPPGICLVHSAGVYPGLSDLLPRWLADHFDHIRALRAWAGGRERCTPAAAADVLLSTLQGFGQAGAVWINGSRRTGVPAPVNAIPVAGFPGPIHVQPFLGEEQARLAMDLGLRDLCWNNVMPGSRISGLLSRWCGLLTLRGAADHTTLRQAVSEIVAAAETEIAGQEPYYRLVLEMDGDRAGRSRRLRAVLRAPDSYRLSAAIAVSAVLQLPAVPPRTGILGAADVLDFASVLERLRLWRVIDGFDVVDVPVTESGDETVSVEEGGI